MTNAIPAPGTIVAIATVGAISHRHRSDMTNTKITRARYVAELAA
ncbi:hypothetical protein [Phocaeicola vulgatus]|nr:hypothetical protein [Phocaeicola vulgatus]